MNMKMNDFKLFKVVLEVTAFLLLFLATLVDMIPTAILIASPVACIAQCVLYLVHADIYYTCRVWIYWLMLSAVVTVILSIVVVVRGTLAHRKDNSEEALVKRTEENAEAIAEQISDAVKEKASE